MSRPRFRLIALALTAYDRVWADLRNLTNRRSGANSSWDARAELAGYEKDGDVVRYNEKEHNRVITAYDDQVKALEVELADARDALLLAIGEKEK